MVLFLFITLLTLMLLGLPISFSLAITALSTFYIFDFASLTTLSHYMYGGLNNPNLIGLPLFILVGSILSCGNLAKYIFDFAQSLLKNLCGGLGMAVIVTSAIFAAISGSSLANAAALGMILMAPLIHYGYGRDFSSGIIATGGTLGVLIPPSLTMILFGFLTEESIGKLFIAGVIPGIISTVALVVLIFFLAKRKGLNVEKTPISLGEVRRSFVKSFPVLLAPVIILGGIYGGIFTPNESAAIAALYCLVVTMFYYRNVKFRDIGKIFSEAASTSAMIMFIVSGAMIFSYTITISQLPQRTMDLMIAANLPTWVFLAILNVLLIVMGCFLDIFSVMLITVPIIYPALLQLGVDPIHLGVIYTLNMEIGTITPPVGMNLFALSSAAKIPVEEVVRGIIPFIICMVLLLILITYFPIFSTWLPSHM